MAFYGGGRFALFMASGASTFYGVTDKVGSMAF